MGFIRTAMLVAALLAPCVAQAVPVSIAGTEGQPVIVRHSGNVTATFEGYSAGFLNYLYLYTDDGIYNNNTYVFNNYYSQVGDTIDLGYFEAGTELIFLLYVHNLEQTYSTGEASRNPDNAWHARVHDWGTDRTLVSFEDTPFGDFDFNDLTFSFTNTYTEKAADADVPEPASMLLMSLGLAGLGAARRAGAGAELELELGLGGQRHCDRNDAACRCGRSLGARQIGAGHGNIALYRHAPR